MEIKLTTFGYEPVGACAYKSCNYCKGELIDYFYYYPRKNVAYCKMCVIPSRRNLKLNEVKVQIGEHEELIRINLPDDQHKGGNIN